MYYILRITRKNWEDPEKFELIDKCETIIEAQERINDLGANLFGYRDYEELSHDASYAWDYPAWRENGRLWDYDWVEDKERRKVVAREWMTFQMRIIEFDK